MEKKTIILVEDDLEVRGMLKGALERQYSVLEASGYSEATKQLKKNIDLAIIDYKLKDSNGLEVLEGIRKVKPALPAIMITAYGYKTLVIKALRAGVTDFVEKPLSIKYLMNKVSEILEGEKGDDEYHERSDSKDEFVMDCIEAYVLENFSENLTCEKIAEMACMNRSKFCKAFKKRFGRTLISYLNSIKIKNAAELLENPDLSITRIAQHIGYENIQHFERVFKRVNGVSPSEFRMNIKKR